MTALTTPKMSQLTARQGPTSFSCSRQPRGSQEAFFRQSWSLPLEAEMAYHNPEIASALYWISETGNLPSSMSHADARENAIEHLRNALEI